MFDEITITLDKERRLCFDFDAMIAFEGITGRNTLQENLMRGFNARDARAFLYVCFKVDDKIITLDDVGKMINKNNIETVVSKCIEAYKKSTPEVEKTKKKNEQK